MDEQDKDIRQFLAGYTVEPASDELLERIMQQAQARPVPVTPMRSAWLKAAPLMAACAVLGFWGGGQMSRAAVVTTPAVYKAQSAEADTLNIDSFILGPTTLQEVTL